MADINSSNLQSAEYNEETKELRITFRSGREYKYFNVPLEKWEEFKATFNSGASAYFAQNFRHWVDFEEVK